LEFYKSVEKLDKEADWNSCW